MKAKRKTKLALALLAAALAAALGAAPAGAAFGISQFDFRFEEADGSAATQAGSHPYAIETFFEVNHHPEEKGESVFEFPDGGDIKDLIVEAVRGFTGDTTAVPRCPAVDLLTLVGNLPSCTPETAVGVTSAFLGEPGNGFAVPATIYNISPPPGVPVRLGFVTVGVPVVIDVSVKPAPDYNVQAALRNIPQPLTVFGGAAQIWGVPADPAHDYARGDCVGGAFRSSEYILEGRLNLKRGAEAEAAKQCPSEAAVKPLLTLPRACSGPLESRYELDAWDNPGLFASGGALSHELSEPFAPIGFGGCGELEFDPGISAVPSTDSAETGSGLDFELDFEDEVDGAASGLTDPEGIAASDLKRIAVTLPEGMTVNPSIGEGLGVCTPADLEGETLASQPGQGCPDASKIGTVSVKTPIVEGEVEGSVFLAQQDDPATATPGAENPFDSLIAFYILLRDRDLGVLVKVPAKVEPDPRSGQLVTTVDEAPQVPFERFRFHFHEGRRAPLITPPACGTYTTRAELTPWARPGETVTRSASFRIERGSGGGPCPPPGTPPFAPGFEAGSRNNSAASYSPFDMRLIRHDGEQDMTRFSATLPPGVLGRLAGVGRCPEAALAAVRARSGRAELASPSCPQGSLIGHTVAGAGVGEALTYVPGFLYLAGPYHGDPLSVAAITPAVAGPFDAGTVLVRVALTVDPVSGEVKADGAASDPIPHILKGIVLKVRDLRVHVDRPQFTLNPTSCAPESTRAKLWGSFRDVFDPADDVAVDLSARYQAADCARLAFRPRLALALRGGTRRGAHPALHAVLRAQPGQANLRRTAVRLPRSAFLEQAHIRTICTRVQFAAGPGNGARCPQGAVYGHVRAYTPLLEEPLEGPAYLRSSNHKLPDLVFALHGIVDIEASARIDSIRGGIRATFSAVPDAPLSRVVVDMQGARKGLIVNSRNLCAARSRAQVRLDAHSGKRRTLHPLLRARCAKQKRAHRRHRRAR